MTDTVPQTTITRENPKTGKITKFDYALVKDRILYFNEHYPNGSIETHLISDVDGERVVIRAVVKPDAFVSRQFTGYSQAKWEGYINAASALENAETSAVGRALAMMGIGVIDSIASQDEINKATDKSSLSEEKKQKLIANKKAILEEDIAKQQQALETSFFGEQNRPNGGGQFIIKQIDEKTASNGSHYTIVQWDGGSASTYDSNLRKMLKLFTKGDKVRLDLKRNGKYTNIVGIAQVSTTPNPDAEEAE